MENGKKIKERKENQDKKREVKGVEDGGVK